MTVWALFPYYVALLVLDIVRHVVQDVDMAKEMFSNRIDSALTDALKAEALVERRSVANMLEMILSERYAKAALTERPVVGAQSPGRGTGSAERAAATDPVPGRSVSPADVAATVPGVKVASAVCGVSPPGRIRPSCSLTVKHDGKHSWEA